MNYDIMNIRTIMASDTKLGGLSFIESEKDIPFPIRRIYCIYQVEEDMQRGYHAHKENWQLMFCPYGSIEIKLNDGVKTETVLLDEPSKGLILHPGLWRELTWKQDDSVLVVAASEYYDSDDYIRDYDEYLAYIKEKKEEDC